MHNEFFEEPINKKLSELQSGKSALQTFSFFLMILSFTTVPWDNPSPAISGLAAPFISV
jgi:hypothetical protein